MTLDTSRAPTPSQQANQGRPGIPDNAVSLIVHIAQVRVVPTGADETDGTPQGDGGPLLFDVGEDLDLLTLSGEPVSVLDAVSLPAGTYTQFGLVTQGDGTLTLDDGTTSPVQIPSGEQVGLRFPHQFDVPQDRTVTFLLDWNTAESIHRTGQGRYVIQPTSLILTDGTG